MNLYIWYRTDPVSGSYHSDGGLMVLAPTVEAAIAVADEQLRPQLAEDLERFKEAEWRTTPPDCTLEVAMTAIARSNIPRVIVFPNAGCC